MMDQGNSNSEIPGQEDFADFSSFQDQEVSSSEWATKEATITDNCPSDPFVQANHCTYQSTGNIAVEQKLKNAFPSASEDVLPVAEASSNENSIVSLRNLLSDNCIWTRVQNHNRSASSKVVWSRSCLFDCFLSALPVDASIAERERAGLPVFASNLGLLQPVKSTPDEKTSSTESNKHPSCDSSASSLSKSNSAPNALNETISIPSAEDTRQSIPLDISQLDLDFLAGKDAGLDHKKSVNNFISGFEVDLPSTSTLIPMQSDQILQNLLSSAQMTVPVTDDKNNSNNSTLMSNNIPLENGSVKGLNTSKSSPSLSSSNHNHHPSSDFHAGLSKEASSILDELPLLSFLRSNVISDEDLQLLPTS